MYEPTELTLEDLVDSPVSPTSVVDKSRTVFKGSGKRGHDSSTKLNSSSSSSQTNFQESFTSSGFYKKKLNKNAKRVQALARGFIVRTSLLRAPLSAKKTAIQTQKERELAVLEAHKQAKLELLLAEHKGSMEHLEKQLRESRIVFARLQEEKAQLEADNAQLKKDLKAEKKIKKELQKECADLLPKVEARKLCDKWTMAIANVEGRINEADNMIMLEVSDIARVKTCVYTIIDVVEAKSELLASKLLKITMDNKLYE